MCFELPSNIGQKEAKMSQYSVPFSTIMYPLLKQVAKDRGDLKYFKENVHFENPGSESWFSDWSNPENK